MDHAQGVQIAWRLPVTHLRHVPSGACHSVPGSTDGEYVAATPVARAKPRPVVGMWTVHSHGQNIIFQYVSRTNHGRTTLRPRGALT
jgi:hypothetical protein